MKKFRYNCLHLPCLLLVNCYYFITHFPRIMRGLLWVLWENRYFINRIINNFFTAIAATALVGTFITFFFCMAIVFG